MANIKEQFYPTHPNGEFAVRLAGGHIALATGVQRVDVQVKAVRVLSRVQPSVPTSRPRL